MSQEAAFDRVLEALVDGGVDFVLIGGLALGSWGVVRGTKDVDIVADDELASRAVQVSSWEPGSASARWTTCER